MILVADSGSTKTDWCGIHKSGEQIFFTTEGYNPFVQTGEYIAESIKRSIGGHVDVSAVDRVYFYGAGCQGEKTGLMARLLRGVFHGASEVSVAVDLLAAARSLLGTSPGFVAILGTGTNTCLYDGFQITHHVDSLGYLLGDEGSGSAIGKSVLVDFLRNRMPEEVGERFVASYQVSPESLLDEIYAAPQPNRYFSAYAKFISAEEVYAGYGKELVRRAFHAFFDNLVTAYPDYHDYEFNCVGSIAHHFSGVLGEVANHYGMKIGKITPYVIDGLVAYHQKNPS